MVKEAVLPFANFNFARNVALVREVLTSPFALLLTDFTNVIVREPDLPVTEHVDLRAFGTVYDSLLFADEVVD